MPIEAVLTVCSYTVTWRLLPERVSSLILTELPVEFHSIMHCGSVELTLESVSSIMIMTYFVYSEKVLIRKINSKKLNQIL